MSTFTAEYFDFSAIPDCEFYGVIIYGENSPSRSVLFVL
jgi:hypothetical protein